MRGDERRRRIEAALDQADLDALIITLPENVLMVSGYWPVVGTAVAVAFRHGRIAVLCPEDEAELAHGGWAGEVRTYSPGSLSNLAGPADSIRRPLHDLLSVLDTSAGKIGYETTPLFEEAPYSALFLWGAALLDLLQTVAPGATLESADTVVTALRSALTADEVQRVRLACEIAGTAFATGESMLRPGVREPDAANAFTGPLSTVGLSREGVARAGGYVWCMSGENSALAGAAYARTRNRDLRPGDLVLVHCNSYVDGYWTDITRTYCLGEPSEQQRAMYAAIFESRAAALASIAPGARAAEVDAAARAVLNDRGFGAQFTHGLGHNVGFSAISAEFPPRIHPASPDILAVGMTFNVEPAIYIRGYGGLRHCDVVTVRDEGPEVLTPFGDSLDSMIITI